MSTLNVGSRVTVLRKTAKPVYFKSKKRYFMKIAFYDAHQYEKQSFEEANKELQYTIDFFDFKLNEKTAATCCGYDAVCVFVNDTLNEEVLQKLAECNVKLIALRCAGFNNVDLDAAKKLGITIVRVPSYSPTAVAEHTAALLLALTRKIPQAYIRAKSGNFTLDGLTGRSLKGLTSGIIGTGKIGKETARIFSGLGMNVLLYDVKPDQEWADKNSFEYATLKELFSNSDVISLQCPLTDETKYIINRHSLELMKPDAILLNTSRGALIETSALVEALKKKRIAGAALDVYEEESKFFFSDWSESIIPDDTLARLLTFPNVIITSHLAFLTYEALSEIAKTTMQNISDYEAGKELANEVVKS